MRPGLNKGLYSLSSGRRCLNYFVQVSRNGFCRGRGLSVFQMSDYSRAPDGTHRFKSLENAEAREAWLARRWSTPPTQGLRFRPHARRNNATAAWPFTCVPPNELPYLRLRTLINMVVGAGKNRDGRLPLAVAERRRTGAHPLDQATRRLAPRSRA